MLIRPVCQRMIIRAIYYASRNTFALMITPGLIFKKKKKKDKAGVPS